MKRSIFAVALIVCLAIAFSSYQELVVSFASSYFTSTDEEPIPTVTARRNDYEIRVRGEGELTGLQTVTISTPRVRTGALRIGWLAEEGSIVEPGAPVVRFDSTDAEMSLEENENTVTSYFHQIEKTGLDAEGQLEVLDLDRQSASLELGFARDQIRKDETIFSRWEIQESVISAALAEFRKLTVEEKAKLQQGLSEADLNILGIDRSKAQAEVDLARETLNSLELNTPVGGVVLYKRIGRWFNPEVGAEVWGRQSIVEIANLQQFQGEVQIPESDSAGIEPGQVVSIELHPFPGESFNGRVTRVSTVAQQRSRNDPRKYFSCTVVIEVPQEVMEELKPGMRLVAEVIVDQKEQVFVVPKSAVFKEEEGFEVFVEDGDTYRAKPVEILDSDHGFYIIAGVEQEDHLCLRHPFEKEKLRLPDFNAPTAATQSRRYIVVF